MAKEQPGKPAKTFRQRHFVARELQFSIALLAVLALLGGIFLQTVFSLLINYYGYNTPFLGVFLVIGYVAIVVILAVFFAHRLIGPFKRLEYEMKLIAGGDLSRKLSIRSRDDLHVRNFVHYTNVFLGNFEEVSKEYSKLNSLVKEKLDEFGKELSCESYDCEKILKEISELRTQVAKFKTRW